MLVKFDRSRQEQLRMTFKDQISSVLVLQKFQSNFLLTLQVLFVLIMLVLFLFHMLLLQDLTW